MGLGARGSIRHTAFLLGVGAAGWAVIGWSAAGASWPGWGAAALFFGVALGARALAFRLADAEVSLDSAFFVAAAVCLGPRTAGLGIGVTLTADAVTRALRRPRSSRGGEAVRVGGAAAYSLYFGGMTGGLLCLVARLFRLEDAAARHELAWLVPALGGTFVFAHYALQAIQQRLAGERWRPALGRLVIGAGAEGTLLPLAIAIALIWDPARPLPVALLGGTYLLVNLGFNRLAKAKAALDRRVVDLETLARSSRALSRTLEEDQQAEALCIETSRALTTAARIELGLLAADGALRQHVFVARRGQISHHAGGHSEADAVRRAELTLDGDVHDPSRPSVRSEIVVPLSRYGEALGAMRIEAAAPDALGADELRIAEAMAAQMTAAVENARLYALATVDGLTGLYVRRYFDARLAEEIERARRFAANFSLIMLDLDDFKRVNDTHGHVAGDRALREVARRATAQLRGVDIAGRYGGEEVAVILPRTSLAAAAPVAERIRAAIAALPLSVGGLDVRLTASLGVTSYTPADDSASVLLRADRALYRAKAAGKNRVELETPEAEVAVAPRASLRA